MKNSFGQNFTRDSNEAVLNVENAATFLGISTATVRNWVKCGYLQSIREDAKYLFYRKEVEDVKSKIKNGDIKRLSKRANKAKAGKTFLPKEYLQDGSSIEELNSIVDFIKINSVGLFPALLLVALNLLKKEQILSKVDIQDVIQKKDLFFTNRQIEEEIRAWILEIESEKIKEEFAFLLDCDIPMQRDVLGFLYQSLLHEGEKSLNGSYYTPSHIVSEVITTYVKKDSKVLDPCCGTGQFLLAFSDVIENPLNIYGIDFDKIAVRIARINILIKYKDRNFIPNVVCKNTLLEVGNKDLLSFRDKSIKDFDIIATNPPWGVHFSKGDLEKLYKFYPEIKSLESFSYFLKKSIDLLSKNGIISFILPESILSVGTHRDIREIILRDSQVIKIVYLNRVFKNVFTPVVRLDIKKCERVKGGIQICKEEKNYSVDQERWLSNQDFVFDIHADGVDTGIIDKIYQMNHTTLKNRADWALGIVTGDNKNFIIEEPREGFEPIYKGKNVNRFVLNETTSYIEFLPERFQQVAPTEKYRSKEKLVYRFISKYLIFAYDNQQKLTLNSANIVIPKIPEYPIKVVVAMFNSSLYQFIFQKKFSSIKILRNHIEQMPLPLWDKKSFSEIIKLVNKILNGEDCFENLDDYIMNKFNLSQEEKSYIIKFNR